MNTAPRCAKVLATDTLEIALVCGAPAEPRGKQLVQDGVILAHGMPVAFEKPVATGGHIETTACETHARAAKAAEQMNGPPYAVGPMPRPRPRPELLTLKSDV